MMYALSTLDTLTERVFYLASFLAAVLAIQKAATA